MLRSLLLVALLACPLLAETTVLPTPGKAVGIVSSDVVGRRWIVLGSDGAPLKANVSPRLDKDGKEVGALCYFEGVGRVTAIQIPKDDDTEMVVVSVVLGPVAPIVVTPPGPVVPPVNPPPPVSPLAGMRVLMIYESDTPLPKEIYDAIMSPAVDEYLRLKCLKGPDGKTPERRRFDDDPPLTDMSQAWKDLRAKLPADLPVGPSGFPIPQVAIGDSSGAVVFSGPIPAPDTAFLELLKKYGGL